MLKDERSTLWRPRLLTDRRSVLAAMAALAAARAGAWPVHGMILPTNYPASVIATGTQGTYDLFGKQGSGPSAGQPAYTSTATTVSLPPNWSVNASTGNFFANTTAGTISNCDCTGFTLWCDDAVNITFTNCLFTGPIANGPLLLNVGSFRPGANVSFNHCTFDGRGIPLANRGGGISLQIGNSPIGGPQQAGSVTMRNCLLQDFGWQGLQISITTDLQFCQFGPNSLTATIDDHTDLCFYFGGTHTFSNNLVDFSLPAADGQATCSSGPECLFNQNAVSAITINSTKCIFRGYANFAAANNNAFGVTGTWTGGAVTVNADHNAVEKDVNGQYFEAGANRVAFNSDGSNRDYVTNAAF